MNKKLVVIIISLVLVIVVLHYWYKNRADPFTINWDKFYSSDDLKDSSKMSSSGDYTKHVEPAWIPDHYEYS